MVLITLVWLLEWFISSYTFIDPTTKLQTAYTIPILLMRIFEPLVLAQNSYPAAVLEIVLMMLLWSVGIHGMNVVMAIALPFWLSTIDANAANPAHATGIVTEPFFHIFTHLGGSGATWPLVIYMLRSKSSQLRTVGKVALGPAIFNINEPVTFGVPMALNPLMMIPFILVPVVIVTLNYLAFSFRPGPCPGGDAAIYCASRDPAGLSRLEETSEEVCCKRSIWRSRHFFIILSSKPGNASSSLAKRPAPSKKRTAWRFRQERGYAPLLKADFFDLKGGDADASGAIFQGQSKKTWCLIQSRI